MYRNLPNFRKYLAVENSIGPKVLLNCFGEEYQSEEDDSLHEIGVKPLLVWNDRSKFKLSGRLPGLLHQRESKSPILTFSL